jgi:hypothetical protein
VAKDVRVSGNSGFQGSTGGYYIDQPVAGHPYNDPWPGAGWLRLIGDDVKPWSRSPLAVEPFRRAFLYYIRDYPYKI